VSVAQAETRNRPSVLGALVDILDSVAAQRAAGDQPDVQGALDKVEEEWQEFRQALEVPPSAAREEELGDLLFALVNVGRFLSIDSEGALRRTIFKFIKRFNVVERTLAKAGKTPETASLEEMEAIWQASKGSGQ